MESLSLWRTPVQTQLPVSRRIQRALDIVDDFFVRVKPLYERRREHRRRKVHKRLLIYPDAPERTGATAAPKCPVEGWSYEIS